MNSSRQLYDEWVRVESIRCEWEARGLLFVFQTQAAMDHYAHTDQLLREEFGVAANRYDGEALNRLEPALKPGLAGGWHYECDAHLRPDRLMAEFRRILLVRGVRILEHCPVERIGDRAVITPRGEIAGDDFVVAAGAWTPLMARELGFRPPIQPGERLFDHDAAARPLSDLPLDF